MSERAPVYLLADSQPGVLPSRRGRIGVATGGCVIHHADGGVEPVLRNAVEFRAEDGRIVESVLSPPDSAQSAS